MAEKKETKIIVKTADELSDIVEKISKSGEDRIILTFTEPSDLLISSINLSVLKETAQEEGKALIIQIIKNPTGERNAQNAGIITINTPNDPVEDLWVNAEREVKDKQIEKEEILGQRPSKEKEEEELPEKSSFEKKIEEALSKSKAQPSSVINSMKVVEEEGVSISLDSDISQHEEKILQKEPLPEEAKAETQESHPVDTRTDTNPSIIGSDVRAKIQPAVKQSIPFKEKLGKIFKFKKKENQSPSNVIKLQKKFTKKHMILAGAGLLVCLLLAGFLYYYFTPLVKVKLYVDSKAVSVEKIFSGSTEISSVDLEEQIVPVIKEEIKKDSSDSITPTGKSVTGEKAKGTVRINYLEIGGTLDLASGTVLTGSGKTFVTLADLHLIGPNWSEVSVEATNYGSEYNVPTGTYFTVAGYSDDTVSGSALSDFSGGSKTEVTVLSQSDVDTASANLAKTAKEDAEGDLLDKHIDDGWEVIGDSVKSEVDEDSVETDVPIGTETTTANISLSVTVSALYYKKEGLEELAPDLLSDEAKNKNLFETAENVELELADDIETKYSVTGSKIDDLKIKMEASGVVTPKIDKQEILDNLSGMDWNEGINYLTGFDYSDQQIEIGFQPSSFPQWLRYFPSRQGRIMISTVYVED